MKATRPFFAAALTVAALFVATTASAEGAPPSSPTPADGPYPLSIAASASYGGGSTPSPFRFGAGATLGYTFPPGIYIGGLVTAYSGHKDTTPGTTVGTVTPTSISSVSIMLYGGQAGFDLQSGMLTLRPHVAGGFGWLQGQLCTGSNCTTSNDQKAFVAPGLSLQAARGHLLVGFDFKYVFVPGATGNIDAPLFSLFAGYRI